MKLRMFLQALAVLKEPFLFRSKTELIYFRHFQDMAYMLQQPFKEELWDLQIVVPQGINETFEWYNCFGLVPKPNGKVWLCLDPARFSEVLIRPIHRGLTVNDISPKLTCL